MRTLIHAIFQENAEILTLSFEVDAGKSDAELVALACERADVKENYLQEIVEVSSVPGMAPSLRRF